MPVMLSRRQLVDPICIAVLVIIFLTVALPRYLTGFDFADEGFLAYGSVRVMEGEMPNRDFVSLQPPFSFYVVATVFKVFGTSLHSLRLLGVAIFLMIAVSVYAIARLLVTPLPALAAAIPATLVGFIFCFVPYAVWQGILWTLLATFCYLLAIFRQRPWLGFIAGIFTTLSVCSRHDQGLYLTVSILVLNIVLILSRKHPVSMPTLWRLLLFWIAGAGVSAALFLLFWWSHGMVPEMWRQLVLFPFSTYRKTSSLPFPRVNLHGTIADNAVALLFCLPIVAVAFIAGWLVRTIVLRGFAIQQAILAFLLTWSALFYCQALTRSDVNHLLITLPPFFILVIYSWCGLLASVTWSRTTRVSVSAVSALLFTSLVWLAGTAGVGYWRKPNEVLSIPRGKIRADAAPLIDSFIRRLQVVVPPERSILCLPYQPMYYFLAERRNPTRWNYLWPGDQTPRDHEQLIEQAERDRPAVVILSGEDEMATYARSIVEFVRRKYVKTAEQGGVSLYVERPD